MEKAIGFDFSIGVPIAEEDINRWHEEVFNALKEGERAYFVRSGNSIVIGVSNDNGNTVIIEVTNGYKEYKYKK